MVISESQPQGLASKMQAVGIQLPKLPELDKADIEAVRSFLPGKLLGRTAAVLVLGFAGLALQLHSD